MSENKKTIEINGWELLSALPIFDMVIQQKVKFTKGSYHLEKLIRLASKVIQENKLLEKRDELVLKYAKAKNPEDKTDRVEVDPDKIDEFTKDADEYFKIAHTIEYEPVKVSMLEESDLRLSMDDRQYLGKFIVED